MIQQGLFSFYQNKQCFLTLSGVGKIPMAIACTMLYCQNSLPSSAIWLNIGSAGHQSYPLGSAYLVHKIIDHTRNAHYYPSFAFKIPCPSEVLTTVDSPETQYSKNTLYDMEGAGFFEVARRFSPLELIHSFKIVSDNIHDHATTKEQISESIEKQLPLLEKITDSLLSLQKTLHASEVPPPSHLTFTEKAQWKALIQKSKALHLNIQNIHSLKQLQTFVHSHVPTHLH